MSYPTIRSRLSRIAEHLDIAGTGPAATGAGVVDRWRGKVSAQEAPAELERFR